VLELGNTEVDDSLSRPLTPLGDTVLVYRRGRPFDIRCGSVMVNSFSLRQKGQMRGGYYFAFCPQRWRDPAFSASLVLCWCRHCTLQRWQTWGPTGAGDWFTFRSKR